MTREQILQILADRLGDGKWALVVLNNEDRALNKELLGKLVNKMYSEKKGTDKELLGSRHMLDEMTARLEGAGLVDISITGRARNYSLSKLGIELIDHLNK